MSIELLCKKLGMTQVFLDTGEAVPVTVLEAGPNVVVQKKTLEKDGYIAVQLAFGERREGLFSKAEKTHFEKNGGSAPKRYVSECHLTEEESAALEPGSEITAAIFGAGQFVDAIGTSKGRGTAGVMKRHNFHGQRASHGVKKCHRHAGSTGCSASPSRVMKGRRMAGRYGASRSTMRNLKVIRIDSENNLLLVRGAVPGPNGGFVTIRETNKL